MKAWYVGMTYGGRELEAERRLSDIGFGTFVPKTHTRHQEGRKVEARTSLRFSGYIFIAFDIDVDPYQYIKGIVGMDGRLGSPLLSSGSGEDRKPLAVRSGLIKKLQAAEKEELAIALSPKKTTPREDLRPGDIVEINDPRDSFHGKTAKYLGSERKVADVMVGNILKEIDERYLKKVDLPETEKKTKKPKKKGVLTDIDSQHVKAA
jgi:transcription antitermination factor NusG